MVDGGLSVDGQAFSPVNADLFASTSSDTLAFERVGGKAVALTLTSVDAAPDRFERFEPRVGTAADLVPYEGTYYSSELQANYRFAVDQAKLTLTIGWLAPVVLEPVAPDEFRSTNGVAVVFRRESTGALGGFDLFAWGIKDVAFSRTTSSTD